METHVVQQRMTLSGGSMKVLLIYPEFPDTFWSFKHALKFISKKASLPPLGLLTVAALFPTEWEVRLVDTNVKELKQRDLDGVDLAFVSAISIQKKAVRGIVDQCHAAGVKVVAGGPLFTTGHDEFREIDCFVLDEAEVTFPLFLRDLQTGSLQRVYSSSVRADVRQTPVPRWDLINLNNYATLSIQYSRGCPFNCEFCDITLLYGRESRTKDTAQILAELNALYMRGWRGHVFFVDDNFIGNKGKLKREVLPVLIQWMKERKYPFIFNTQVSINIADDKELLAMMSAAGFAAVFVGIETPLEESLSECDKVQNKRRDLLACVRTIQEHGMEVQAGFIVGFDNDPPAVFERQIAFIQESGIVTAMVGILNALKGTRLYRRMEQERRLITDDTGDNTDGSINFIPRMEPSKLMEGYRTIVATIYDPRKYYQRIVAYLKQYKPAAQRCMRLKAIHIVAFLRSVVMLGIITPERVYFWRLLFRTLFTRPQLVPQAIAFAIYGYHYRRVFECVTSVVRPT
jgi:radical SAM superfamily enzyme YgiQ (UPF0313 family)